MNSGSKRPSCYKQFADVVESISGAVTIACGLNYTMDFLRSRNILTVTQDALLEKIDILADGMIE